MAKWTQRPAPEVDPERPRRSLMGCGCAVVMAVVLATILGLSWFSYLKGKRFREELGDPQARATRSREILGYRELPAGYHPMGGFSVPFSMTMAMLSDRDPAPGEVVHGPEDAFRSHGFVFMKTRLSGSQEKELREYFAGRRETAGFFHEVDLEIEDQESLGRGRVEAGGGGVLYVAGRGRMKLGGETVDEVIARLLVECPGDRGLRVALWFEPVPAATDGGAPSRAGTPADPEALRRFLDHFALCAS